MALWDDIAEKISEAINEPFVIEQQSSKGGCISSAYLLKGNGKQYFVKTTRGDQLEMFLAEAEGLQELAGANTGANAEAVKIPAVIAVDEVKHTAFIAMEYVELGGQGSMHEFGERLAAMHRHTSENNKFGWHRDNTIGATPQPNAWHHDWVQFWQEQRLGHQLQLAQSNGAPASLIDKGQRLNQHVADLFTGYQPEPSVLHGDLWSGNYSFVASGTDAGRPVIFDPAVYYGDREAEIAMTELFGGFSHDFYEAYNHAWPLDQGYAVRKTFYNLYHIINHFNLFGGGYASQAQSMTERLLAEVA